MVAARIKPEMGKVSEIMNFCYKSLLPERSHTGKDPEKILRGGHAWCAGYAIVMKHLCEKRGYPARIITMVSKNHPKGRGKNREESHVVTEVRVNGKWAVFDPTTNKRLGHSINTLLRNPELVDRAVRGQKKDRRWRERGYSGYCSGRFYRNVTKINVKTGNPLLDYIFWDRGDFLKKNFSPRKVLVLNLRRLLKLL